MNLRQKLLASQAERILRAALVMGMLTGVTDIFASIDSSRLTGRGPGYSSSYGDDWKPSKGSSKPRKKELLGNGQEALDGRESSSDLLDSELRLSLDSSVAKHDLLRLIDKYSSSKSQDKYDNLWKVVYAFMERVSSLDSYLKDRGKVYNLNRHMFGQSISGMFALSSSIRDALDDKPDEDAKIAYLLLMNEFSALDVDSFSKSGLNSENPGGTFHFVINYLVYGVGLEKIGSDKIIEALKSSLSSGEVALYDFAERLFDLTVRYSLNYEKERGEIVKDQILRCLKSVDKMKSLYDSTTQKELDVGVCVKEIDGSWISQYIAFVKDWRNVTEDEMGKVKNFVQLVLKHYSKFDTISDLPLKVRNILMPYLMLILNGLPVYDRSDEHKEWINGIEGMQESKISDLQKKIAEAKFSEVSDKQREIYTKLNVWLDGCVERGEEREKWEREKWEREGLKYEYEYEYRDIGGKLLKLYLITRKARTNLYRVKTGDLIRDNVRVPWAGWMYGLSVPEGRENDSYTLEVWR